MWGNIAEAFVALAMILFLPAALGTLVLLGWLCNRLLRRRHRLG